MKKKTVAEWDNYWAANKHSQRKLYDFIASIYRTLIIKRALNHFVIKYLKQGSHILHAGCGGGQVDADLQSRVNISALDISPNALKQYSANNPNANVVLGNILDLPYGENSFDGIYNLGVMEHFTEDDIQKILLEFKRVLKPDGWIILFWPPEFGISVIFFKILTFLCKYILFRKDVKFHPDEITRLRTKQHAISILNQAGFKPVECYFGTKDFFTHLIVVARKRA